MSLNSIKPNNNGERTLLILAGDPLGTTSELLTVGDVIQVADLAPLIIREINDYAAFEETEADAYASFACSKVAYLHYENDVAMKFAKKRTSQKLEKNLAKKLKGKTTPGSGAFDFHKGDIKSDEFLGEHKYTDKQEYRLTLKTWNKIANEAYSVDKIPLMEIVIDQNSEPIYLIVMTVLDFCDVLGINNEQEFVNQFLTLPLTSSAQSILLKKEVLAKHIEDVTYNWEGRHPTFLVNIGETVLVGAVTNDFVGKLNDKKSID